MEVRSSLLLSAFANWSSLLLLHFPLPWPPLYIPNIADLSNPPQQHYLPQYITVNLLSEADFASDAEMGMASEDSIRDFESVMDQIDEPLKRTFENVHQGYPDVTFSRFLRARDGNVSDAQKMLLDCLNWRLQNQIDSILSKPILPDELYRGVRDSQLIGMSGYTREGHPVFGIGAGLSTFDKASVNYYVQSHIQINEYRDRVILPSATKMHGTHINKCVKVLDMTGLRLSALSHIKLMTLISSIDDLNYPEKTKTYYIVNAPYVFSACWKVVKPLLQERTRKKVQVLSGCGQDELLKIMDYDSLPHFCRKQDPSECNSCFSLDHPFHQQLYAYIKDQASLLEPDGPARLESFRVNHPKTEEIAEDEIAQSIKSELHNLEISGSPDGSTSSDDQKQ